MEKEILEIVLIRNYFFSKCPSKLFFIVGVASTKTQLNLRQKMESVVLKILLFTQRERERERERVKHTLCKRQRKGKSQ